MARTVGVGAKEVKEIKRYKLLSIAYKISYKDVMYSTRNIVNINDNTDIIVISNYYAVHLKLV